MNPTNPAPPVLITGASGGIGADLARVFARHGHPVALVARSGEALDALARELGEPGGRPPIAVAFDLAAADAPALLSARLEAEDFIPAILVNNAGYGLNGPVLKLDFAAQIGIIDLNIRTLTALTLHFLPGIVRARGRILNVASIAAFMPGPGMAVYYASKAYVLSFGDALSQEMAAHGVSVTTLCPGPTATNFFRRAGGKTGKLKAFGMMDSPRVAEAGYRGLMAGRRIVVPGVMNRVVTTLAPLVPKRLLLPAMARLQLER